MDSSADKRAVAKASIGFAYDEDAPADTTSTRDVSAAREDAARHHEDIDSAAERILRHHLPADRDAASALATLNRIEQLRARMKLGGGTVDLVRKGRAGSGR